MAQIGPGFARVVVAHLTVGVALAAYLLVVITETRLAPAVAAGEPR
ncbi:hypothetical protein [Actinoplanes subtropicus]|nr:hypothetical protein [Actinoplanes subtropicus]